MKNIIFLIISLVIAITLTSGVQKNEAITKTVTLMAVTLNPESASLKKSAEIISERLKLSGLSTYEVKVVEGKGQLTVLLPEKANITEMEGLLTSRGELTFFETYGKNEITELLKKEDLVFKMLGIDKEQNESDPRIGFTGIENLKKADDYLRTVVPVKNCRLLWGFESEKQEYCLFALRTGMDGKPLLARTDIESVKIIAGENKQDTKIRISLKQSAKSIFAEATRHNMNKAIAIVFDDKVYSWPVVRSVIEGGEIEVTGNFSVKEANYFPLIFNTEQLPLDFKLIK
jgi:preprotein translocase subunit SecD